MERSADLPLSDPSGISQPLQSSVKETNEKSSCELQDINQTLISPSIMISNANLAWDEIRIELTRKENQPVSGEEASNVETKQSAASVKVDSEHAEKIDLLDEKLRDVDISTKMESELLQNCLEIEIDQRQKNEEYKDGANELKKLEKKIGVLEGEIEILKVEWNQLARNFEDEKSLRKLHNEELERQINLVWKFVTEKEEAMKKKMEKQMEVIEENMIKDKAEFETDLEKNMTKYLAEFETELEEKMTKYIVEFETKLENQMKVFEEGLKKDRAEMRAEYRELEEEIRSLRKEIKNQEHFRIKLLSQSLHPMKDVLNFYIDNWLKRLRKNFIVIYRLI